MEHDRKEGSQDYTHGSVVQSPADAAVGAVGSIAGTIAAIGALVGAGSALTQLLAQLSAEQAGRDWRSCAIGIQNETEHSLIEPAYWLYSGRVTDYTRGGDPGHDAGVAADKLPGELKGSVGVMTYKIEGTGHKVAFLWSVPFDRTLYDSWFKGAIIADRFAPNKAMYNDMYYNEHVITAGDVCKAGQYGRWSGGGFEVAGDMTNAENAMLQLVLRKHD